jgi:hypothetical protein
MNLTIKLSVRNLFKHVHFGFKINQNQQKEKIATSKQENMGKYNT